MLLQVLLLEQGAHLQEMVAVTAAAGQIPISVALAEPEDILVPGVLVVLDILQDLAVLVAGAVAGECLIIAQVLQF